MTNGERASRAVHVARQALSVARGGALLRAHGVRVGALPRVHGRRLHVSNRGETTVGDRLWLDARHLPAFLTTLPGGRLVLGDDVYVNEGVDVWAAQEVVVGDRVLLGPRVTIVDDTAHDLAPDRPRKVAPVRIGDDAWLGRGCVVLPGVTIGRHAVVGTGAVVTSDVPDCTVVAGVPARPVRTLDVPVGWRRTS